MWDVVGRTVREAAIGEWQWCYVKLCRGLADVEWLSDFSMWSSVVEDLDEC